MRSFIIASVTLALGYLQVVTAQAATTTTPLSVFPAASTPTCTSSSYDSPFTLYTWHTWPPFGGIGPVIKPWPVRLLSEDASKPNISSLVYSTDRTCGDDCGKIPSGWSLDSGVLSVHFADDQDGYTTVDLGATAGSAPTFVNSPIVGAPSVPAWCVATSPNGPEQLAVNQVAQFSACPSSSNPSVMDLVWNLDEDTADDEGCESFWLIPMPLS